MKTKAQNRKRIHRRIRKKIKGTAEMPRLHVYRSNKGIYGSLINDLDGLTITSVRSTDVDQAGTKSEVAKRVGSLLAEKAKDHGITSVKFDRGGYLYHGRVKALADGARESGLTF